MRTSLAKSQYAPNAADLETVLALARGGTLASAAERLGVDASTVFRNLQRILRSLADATDVRADWVAPDDALPEHPSVLRRKRRYPKLQPRYRVSSILMVEQFVVQGIAVGVLPLFLAQRRRSELRALTEPSTKPIPSCGC